jgi:hypothetical protein
MPATDLSWRPARRVSVAIASPLILLAFATGCGSSDHDTTTRPSFTRLHEFQVTAEEVSDAGQGSPAAALLGWWRSLQLSASSKSSQSNPKAYDEAKAAYARSVNLRRTDHRRLSLRGEIDALSSYLRRSRPEVDRVTERDGTARISAVINSGIFKDPTHVRLIRRTPASFELRQEAGTWKLANDDYLRQTVQLPAPRLG